MSLTILGPSSVFCFLTTVRQPAGLLFDAGRTGRGAPGPRPKSRLGKGRGAAGARSASCPPLVLGGQRCPRRHVQRRHGHDVGRDRAAWRGARRLPGAARWRGRPAVTLARGPAYPRPQFLPCVGDVGGAWNWHSSAGTAACVCR